MGQYETTRTALTVLISSLFKAQYLAAGHPDSEEMDLMISVRVRVEIDAFEHEAVLRHQAQTIKLSAKRVYWVGVSQSIVAAVAYTILLYVGAFLLAASKIDPLAALRVAEPAKAPVPAAEVRKTALPRPPAN